MFSHRNLHFIGMGFQSLRTKLILFAIRMHVVMVIVLTHGMQNTYAVNFEISFKDRGKMKKIYSVVNSGI